MTIIHGCWLEEDDIQLMAERDVRLVYNPASNMFLGDGVTRIVDMHAAGMRLGLGSDGGCSNNRVSVFDEMRMCALLQKVTHLYSEVVPAESGLRDGHDLAAPRRSACPLDASRRTATPTSSCWTWTIPRSSRRGATRRSRLLDDAAGHPRGDRRRPDCLPRRRAHEGQLGRCARRAA